MINWNEVSMTREIISARMMSSGILHFRSRCLDGIEESKRDQKLPREGGAECE